MITIEKIFEKIIDRIDKSHIIIKAFCLYFTMILLIPVFFFIILPVGRVCGIYHIIIKKEK